MQEYTPVYLFVFEGEKTERQYLHKIIDLFNLDIFKDKIEIAYCASIYNLYKEVKKYDDSVDIFKLFTSFKNLSKFELKNIDSDTIASTYLFFDYDKVDEAKIGKMLKFFDNETEQGKLYINYPMLESLRDTDNNILNFQDFETYKEIVNKSGIEIQNINSKIIKNHIQKTNILVNNNNSFPTKYIHQDEILSSQIKYINKEQIFVLSSFSLWVMDYFGVKKFKEILKS
jgi:hypothetical protein